jgi:hypothetical protein
VKGGTHDMHEWTFSATADWAVAVMLAAVIASMLV